MHGEVTVSADKVSLLPASFLPDQCTKIAGTSMYPQQFSVMVTYTAAVLCNSSTMYGVTAAVRTVSEQHCQPVLTAYRVVLAIDADCMLVLYCCSALYVMHTSLR